MALHNLTSLNGAPSQQVARPLSPNAPLALSYALQTTLELDELLTIFFEKIREQLPLDGVSFRLETLQLGLEKGQLGRHRVGYNLQLLDESLGTLTFTRGRRFSAEEMSSLEELLVALLYPLRNALQYRAALNAAFHDPLTGAGNRASLEQSLKREVELACRHRTPLVMLVLDLDHFKRINDSYGHHVGDGVLKETAQRITTSLRGTDLFFRFGGEEFVILLSNTPVDGALQVAERLRCSIAEQHYRVDGKELEVTTSIGVALCGENESPMSLFEKADRALYRAKALGRNRVIAHEE